MIARFNHAVFKRPLSIGLVLTLGIFFSVVAHSSPQYAITVVGEAQVMKEGAQPTLSSRPRLTSKSDESVAVASAKMNRRGFGTSEPIKMMELRKGVALYATYFTDEAWDNTVTIWLSIREKNSTRHFALSEILTEKTELPKIRLESDTLIIEANSMKPDPNEQNYLLLGSATLPTPLYQTVRLGDVSQEGIRLKTMTCIQ